MRQRLTATPDIRPSEDDEITDAVEYDQPVIDISDDWHTGEPFNQTSDQAPTAELIRTITQLMLTEIKDEARRLAMVDGQFVRVSTNHSGSAQFRRYSITSAMGPVQILWEKEFRGRALITNLQTAAGSIWICDEAGMFASGSNTAEVQFGKSREVRTREELYAITDSATAILFDVQEEFDA
jgi:hypothetical protein